MVPPALVPESYIPEDVLDLAVIIGAIERRKGQEPDEFIIRLLREQIETMRSALSLNGTPTNPTDTRMANIILDEQKSVHRINKIGKTALD